MFQKVKQFIGSESGAVTVDWVVLCAAIVALTVALLASMQTGTLGLTDSTANFMTGYLK